MRARIDLLVYLVLFPVSYVCVVLPVRPFDVWPINHENISFFLRTRVYAQHFGFGDLFPVWSSMDNLSLGSPFPALYHKLFYFVSGALNALGLTERSAIILAIAFFLWLGAIGMWHLMRRLGCGGVTAAAAALYFLFANYTVTNWLIRGAMAELSAMALLPWLVWSFFVSLDEQRIVKRLGLILALMFLAHPVMAYFSTMTLAVAAVVVVCTGRLKLTWQLVFRSVPTVVVFAAAILPYAVAMLVFSSGYDLSRLTYEAILPKNQLRLISSYLWDPHWRWGETQVGYTTQLDLPLILLLLTSMVLLAVRRMSLTRRRLVDLTVLLIVFAFCFALQMEWSTGFYDIVPGAHYIQFPWRLLAIMTTVLIALAMATAETTSKTTGPLLSIVALLAGILTSGIIRPIEYGQFPSIPDIMILGENNVYQPERAQFGDPQMFLDAVRQQDCSVRSLSEESDAVTEKPSRHFEVHCETAMRIALPFYATPGLDLRIGPQRRRHECLEQNGFASLCAVDLEAGRTEVSVRFPTLWSIVSSSAVFKPGSR